MATLQDYLGITKLRDAWPKWKANVIAINNQVIAHVAGTADKHAARDTTYSGNFTSMADVKAALDRAKTEIDTIVVNASVDPEVALARESSVKAKTFATIDGRLEESEQDFVSYKAENATELYQSDLINKINRLVDYDGLYFMRESGHVDLTMILKKGTNYIAWAMRRNTFDDFWQLGECFSGVTIPVYDLIERKNYDTLTGTFITTDVYSHYTVTIGDSFVGQVIGSKIDFYHYARDDGGIWEFTVDGDTNNKVTISTWSAVTSTSLTMQPKTLFTNLTDTTHTIVGVFKGDDPLHVPSGGAGTARGWVWFHGGALNDKYTFHGYRDTVSQFTLSRDKELVVGFSNKELALQMKPLDIAITPAYTPMHADIGTTYNRVPREIYADGVLLPTDLTIYPSYQVYPCKEISFVQKMRAKIPNYANDLVNFDVVHTFRGNGNVEVNGRLTVLEPIDVIELFTFMLPVSKASVDRLVSAKNNYYPCTLTGGEITDLTQTEGDTTASFAFTSSVDPDYIIAGRANNISETLRRGEVDKGSVYTWIQHRDASMTKLYTYAMRNGILQTGDIIKFSQTFNCAKIPNIHNII